VLIWGFGLLISDVVLFWNFSPIKDACLSFHLKVIWVLGNKYNRRKWMNLLKRSEISSAKTGLENGLAWAPYGCGFLNLFTPSLRRHMRGITIKISY